MNFRLSIIAALVALTLAGCAAGPPFIERMQPKAQDMALRRAQFDMNCPAATSQIIDSQKLEPLLFGGPERATYTVGVIGCGQRRTVTVICSDNSDQCVEVAPGR